MLCVNKTITEQPLIPAVKPKLIPPNFMQIWLGFGHNPEYPAISTEAQVIADQSPKKIASSSNGYPNTPIGIRRISLSEDRIPQ